MKKTFYLLTIFLFTIILMSCTNLLNEPVITDTPSSDTTIENPPPVLSDPFTDTAILETEATTEIETEPTTIEEIHIPDFPDTVYIQLTSEEIADRAKTVNTSDRFELKEGFFITEPVAFNQVVEENRPELDFFVSDMTYEVQYTYSMISTAKQHPSYYVYTDTTENVVFKISQDNILLEYYNSDIHYGTSNIPVANDRASQIADTFISTYYPDVNIEAFTVSVHSFTGDSINSPYTVIQYDRKLYGYTIGETIEIAVNSDGQISSVITQNLGKCDLYPNFTDEQLNKFREQLINSIVYAAKLPVDNHGEHLMIGSDGNLYMYMDGTGWTFNDEGMIDDNSVKVTDTYYVRLNP